MVLATLRTTEVEEHVKAAAGVSSWTAAEPLCFARDVSSSGRSFPQYVRQPAAAPAHHSLGVPAESGQIPLPQVSSSSVHQPVATPTRVARQTASRSCVEANRGRWAKVSDLPQASLDEVAAQADITTAAAERVERKFAVTAPIYAQRNSPRTNAFRTRARSMEPGGERVADNRSASPFRVDLKRAASGFKQHQRGCALLPGAVERDDNKAERRGSASPRGRGAGRLAWGGPPATDKEGGEDGPSACGGASASSLALAGLLLRPATMRSSHDRVVGGEARSGQPLPVGGASRPQQQRCSATPPVPPTAPGDGAGAVAGKSDGGGAAAADKRTPLRPRVSITTRPD